MEEFPSNHLNGGYAENFSLPNSLAVEEYGWIHYITVGGDMENIVPIEVQRVKQYRKSLRLTFRVADGEVRLMSYERLDMICPPSVGERPETGRNGGFWMELRDTNNRVLFHRILNNPLGDSVEVHSPDGKIQRVFGAVEENVFEVLLPDDSQAKTIAFIGESMEPATVRQERVAAARELAHFNVPEGMKGGDVNIRGGR